MIILGIDPGTATTGWGIIKKTENIKQPPARPRRAKQAGRAAENKNSSSLRAGGYSLSLIGFGCILTDSKEEMGKRLLNLKKSLQNIIKNYRPEKIVVEKIFFGANSTSALSVGQARGVVLLVAAESKLPIFEYTGLEVKLAVADHGRADKKAIQTAVRRHLGINRLPHPKDQLGRRAFTFRDDAYDAVAATICHVIKQRTASSEQQTTNKG